METVIYECDYRKKFKETTVSPEALCSVELPERLKAAGVFQLMIPKGAADYCRLLGRLDALAREYGGTILGRVDPVEGEAEIRVTLPFFEFFMDEEIELLRDMAACGQYLGFLPQGEEKIALSLLVPCFRAAENS